MNNLLSRGPSPTNAKCTSIAAGHEFGDADKYVRPFLRAKRATKPTRGPCGVHQGLGEKTPTPPGYNVSLSTPFGISVTVLRGHRAKRSAYAALTHHHERRPVMWLTASRVGEFSCRVGATAGVCVRRPTMPGYVCIWEVSMDNIDMAGTNKLRGELEELHKGSSRNG